jgi:hypothetical protein
VNQCQSSLARVLDDRSVLWREHGAILQATNRGDRTCRTNADASTGGDGNRVRMIVRLDGLSFGLLAVARLVVLTVVRSRMRWWLGVRGAP